MVKTGNIETQQTRNVFKNWKKVEKGVVRTTEQVCGIKKRQTNDWLTGHMEELQKLVKERKEASKVGNEQKRLYNLNQSMRNEQAFNYAVEHLKTVRTDSDDVSEHGKTSGGKTWRWNVKRPGLKATSVRCIAFWADYSYVGLTRTTAKAPSSSAKKSSKNTWMLYRRIVLRTLKKRWLKQ